MESECCVPSSLCRRYSGGLVDVVFVRTSQIGIVTYDSCIHFYNMRPTLSSPHMIVVPDISDVFLPLPEDLLVNLSESRVLVEMLLDSLPKVCSRNVGIHQSFHGWLVESFVFVCLFCHLYCCADVGLRACLGAAAASVVVVVVAHRCCAFAMTC